MDTVRQHCKESNSRCSLEKTGAVVEEYNAKGFVDAGYDVLPDSFDSDLFEFMGQLNTKSEVITYYYKIYRPNSHDQN